jgi:benzodiazapine receptor
MQTVRFIIALMVCFGASGLGALFMSNDAVGNWYEQLQKPSITPPDWVFGPAWTILYIMMSISVFLVWNKGLDHPKVKLAICIFLIQLTLNAAWTPMFFGFHLILPALIDIVLLFIAILITMLAFKGISFWASMLLLPYLLWVGFATILNAMIWNLNR